MQGSHEPLQEVSSSVLGWQRLPRKRGLSQCGWLDRRTLLGPQREIDRELAFTLPQPRSGSLSDEQSLETVDHGWVQLPAVPASPVSLDRRMPRGEPRRVDRDEPWDDRPALREIRMRAWTCDSIEHLAIAVHCLGHALPSPPARPRNPPPELILLEETQARVAPRSVRRDAVRIGSDQERSGTNRQRRRACLAAHGTRPALRVAVMSHRAHPGAPCDSASSG